jgi:hypothetical protein
LYYVHQVPVRDRQVLCVNYFDCLDVAAKSHAEDFSRGGCDRFHPETQSPEDTLREGLRRGLLLQAMFFPRGWGGRSFLDRLKDAVGDDF